MKKHFQHIPVKIPDVEAGIPTFEHCLNLIGENYDFWQGIDHFFETETSQKNKETIFSFKSDLLQYLANFIYENPPRVADNNVRQAKIDALESISNAVAKILKNYKYVTTDIFLHFSEKAYWLMEETQRQGDNPQSDDLQWSAYRKERELLENLNLLQKITQKTLPTNEDPAIMNAHLQGCMAIYLAELLLNIDITPTTSREGIFEELFRLCCIVIGFKEPKPGKSACGKRCKIH